MQSLDKTLDLIPISLIESIIKDSNIFFKLIRTPNDSMFNEHSINDIVHAINDYMNYKIKNSESLTKDEFERVNYLNQYINSEVTFDFEKYLDQTAPLVPIEELEQILSNEDLYNKFINFEENRDIFKQDMNTYLSGLNQMIKYYNEKNIEISYEQITRFREIIKLYSLEMKSLHVLDGYKYEEDLNEELVNKVLENVDLNLDPFTLSRAIYINLCKLVTYDVEFTVLDQDLTNEKALEIYERKPESIDVNNNKVVCKTWAEIYQNLLQRVNINADVVGKKHKYVKFDCDGTLMMADATNSYYERTSNFHLDDITRIQLDLPTSGFRCLENDKNIDLPLKKADEKIEYYKTSIEQKFMSLEKSYCTVKPKVLDKENNMKEKFIFLQSILDNTTLEGFELNKYATMILNNIFGNNEVEYFHSAIKDDNNEFECSLIFTILINNDRKYMIYNKSNGLKELSKENLEYLISNDIIKIVSKRKNIPGIMEVENEYTETTRNK